MYTRWKEVGEHKANALGRYREPLHPIGQHLYQPRSHEYWKSCTCTAAYFLAFYTVLGAFFIGYLHALMYFHIDRDRPWLTGPSSVLGFNPGLSIVPRPDLYSSLIRTTSRSIEVYQGFATELMAFLEPYQRPADRVEMMQCARGDGSYSFERTRPCAFDLNSAWPCSINADFGYDGESPCILLKMNKVYGWLPDPVEGATGVVVKCEGVTKDDDLNLGEIRYYDLDHHYSAKGWEALIEGKKDNGTFHADFFPYLNQQWYLQPIVWVMFRDMQRDSFTRVQCYLIAKNIHVDLSSGEGSIRFEILVE